MCHDFHQHSRILLKTLRHLSNNSVDIIDDNDNDVDNAVDDNDDRVDDSYYDDDDNADDLCKLSARCRRFA